MPITPKVDPLMLDNDDDEVRRVVIEAARELIGVPFKVHGKGPGGVDCTGLCAYAADKAGLVIASFDHLDPELSGEPYLDEIRARMNEIDPEDARPGDWFAMNYKGAARHFALLSENATLIQASYLRNAVTEHGFTEREQSRVEAAFRFVELA